MDSIVAYIYILEKSQSHPNAFSLKNIIKNNEIILQGYDEEVLCKHLMVCHKIKIIVRINNKLFRP